jgi:hypothetical protein
VSALDVMVRMQPPESLAKGLATKEEKARWTPLERMLRTCQYCTRAYKNAGYTYRCEHAHERSP